MARAPRLPDSIQLALRELQSKIESDVTAVLEPYLLPHNHIVHALAP
jgi:hypothetical protein